MERSHGMKTSSKIHGPGVLRPDPMDSIDFKEFIKEYDDVSKEFKDSAGSSELKEEGNNASNHEEKWQSTEIRDKKRSEVWKYFDIDPNDSNKVTCNKCLTSLKYPPTGTTTYMWTHLNNTHGMKTIASCAPNEVIGIRIDHDAVDQQVTSSRRWARTSSNAHQSCH